MKILADACYFSGRQPHLTNTEGNTRYFTSGEPESVDFILMPTRPDWSLLWGNHIYHEDLAPGFHHRRENAPFFALEYIREGDLYFHQEGRAYLAERGDVCLMHSGKFQEFATGPAGYCRKSSLLMIGPLLENTIERAGLGSIDVLDTVDTVRLDTLLDLFKKTAHDLGGTAAVQLSCYAFEVLQLLAKRERSPCIPSEMTGLLEFMNSHLERKLSLLDLARRYGCSQSHLIRMFHLYFKIPPYRMLTRLRMRRAAHLLMEPRLSVKEIAARTGYSNQLNFSTEFRKHYRVSPKQYRRKGGFSPL